MSIWQNRTRPTPAPPPTPPNRKPAEQKRTQDRGHDPAPIDGLQVWESRDHATDKAIPGWWSSRYGTRGTICGARDPIDAAHFAIRTEIEWTQQQQTGAPA